MNNIFKVIQGVLSISVILLVAFLLYIYMGNNTQEEVSELSVDPIFGQTLSGTNPQTVHWYEAGDDIRPNLYEVVYFPEVVTNGTQGHYEVYRTLGKDR